MADVQLIGGIWPYDARVHAVVLGRRNADHLAIEVWGRAHPQATDFEDGNWLACQVSVRAGAFSGRYAPTLRAEEFQRFTTGVRRLNDTLKGEAEFRTLEEQLTLRIERVGSLGDLRLVGTARGAAGTGNLLSFQLHEFDQTDLPGVLAALTEVTGAFPVIGR